MEITIIGAGMAGLTTGIALKKFGHQVTIYEQAEQILPVVLLFRYGLTV